MKTALPDIRISVIIPTFGRPESVRAALESLARQTLPPGNFEALVADSSLDDQVARVVAGMVDHKSATYMDDLQQLSGGDGTVLFVINPTQPELDLLYQGCYGGLFTAFNEDWGLVPLELMARGKPVIAVNRGGPTETVDHGVNGLLVEDDPESFAQVMLRLGLGR